jgi:hypothetical protein
VSQASDTTGQVQKKNHPMPEVSQPRAPSSWGMPLASPSGCGLFQSGFRWYHSPGSLNHRLLAVILSGSFFPVIPNCCDIPPLFACAAITALRFRFAPALRDHPCGSSESRPSRPNQRDGL